MKTYREVAEHYGLRGVVVDRYVAYMQKRWGDPKDEEIKCQVGYAQEWAERFKTGIEMASSDSYGKRILSEIDAGHYGKAWSY